MDVEGGNASTPLKPRLGDLNQVEKSPQGIIQYVNGLFGFLGRTVAFFIIVAFMSVIPIVMLSIGAAYKDQCKANPKIPIYLIVFGVFGILKSVLQVINNVRVRNRLKNGQSELRNTDPLKMLDSLISMFLFIWMICGSVWVFQMWKPVSWEECNQTVYMTAFVFLLLGWILIIIGISLCCCLCAVVCCCGALFAASEDRRHP